MDPDTDSDTDSETENEERLREAAAQGDAAEVARLLSEGAPLHTFDALDWTPLHHAARGGHREVMRLLVEARADPAIPGWMQRTALQRAQERKRDEGRRVAELLAQAAQNPGKRLRRKNTN